jgi:hypothetical protein
MTNQNNNIDLQYYTEYAIKFVNQNLNNQNTIKIYEETTIDGCDRYGPKAYIYYLFVIVINPNYNQTTDQMKYIYQIYSADQYFHKNEIVEYALCSSKQSNQLQRFRSWNDYHNIEKNNNEY